MFRHGNIQQLFPGIEIQIGDGIATLALPVTENYFHAAHSMHGAVYFKLLDDAAFFAVQSQEREYFIFTASFQVRLLRPVTGGILTASGEWMPSEGRVASGRSQLRDAEGALVADAEGKFVRSKIKLSEVSGYAVQK